MDSFSVSYTGLHDKYFTRVCWKYRKTGDSICQSDSALSGRRGWEWSRTKPRLA